MGVERRVLFLCDCCDNEAETDDSLHPPEGWGAVVIVPAPEMAANEGKRRVLCADCMAEVRQAVGLTATSNGRGSSDAR